MMQLLKGRRFVRRGKDCRVATIGSRICWEDENIDVITILYIHVCNSIPLQRHLDLTARTEEFRSDSVVPLNLVQASRDATDKGSEFRYNSLISHL